MLRQIGIARNARGHNQQKKFFFVGQYLCQKMAIFSLKLSFFTTALSLVMRGLGGCWHPPRLVLEKNISDVVYIHPGGVRTAMALFFLQSVI